ncbi:MAG: hypothetical protein IIU58_04380 [Clostridia bacterium]|nr:hypothetical protein [Clostridia bacterium]
MKKLCLLIFAVCVSFTLCFSCAGAQADALAEAIADCIGKEPFVVRVAFGELLLNRVDSVGFPDTVDEVALDFADGHIRDASESDRRAAAAALRRFGFAGGALYVKKWEDVENTPLVMRSGVRLYDWYFYI